MQVFTLDHCENIKLENFSVNWKKPLVAEGSVVAKNELEVDVFVDPDTFPHRFENGNLKFIKTTKQRISTLSCYEQESEISAEQYENELRNADSKRSTVIKTRYAFPFASHTVEIDVYPFWNDRAILEIEMSSENEGIEIPDFLDIIKEVSLDNRYKNTNLAISIPFDAI